MNWKSLLLIGTASACASCQLADPQTKVAEVLNPRRPASLVWWQDKQLHGRPALSFTPSVTAVVMPPAIRQETEVRLLPGNVFRFDTRFVFKDTGTAGSAVPITRDGYFLTAAHCVDENPEYNLLALTSDLQFTEAPARVIWAGDHLNGGPDLALLHAPLTPFATLDPAPLHAAAKKDPILTSGFGSKGFPRLEQGESGGLILSLKKIQHSPAIGPWRLILHSAPLAHGDSGGPLISESGLLLGINSQVHSSAIFPLGMNQIWRYRGVAVAADPAWIQSLIQTDRASRAKKTKKSPNPRKR